MARDFSSLLEQLRQGSIKELKVEADEFNEFQPIYMKYDQRKRVIGEAQRNGTVIYRFENNENGQQ
ncbi:hypothetical protein [Pediococcus cellicola]|uniref:Uncharacterized protein n=1 Tax=Pediococcus cellicola TaxID=319652 RepID=A0A0R2IMD6_9LACO|nr:hypothetical protein [Pediococcus cellicola]KRN66107.1 hypothetical protein IV80_GL001669 [Pediococcus cellicola]GEL15420.1 hypothetical protein PCE01_12220 [Pediococcus cellicola]